MAFEYNKLMFLALVLAAATAVQSIPAETNVAGRKLRQALPSQRTQVKLNNILEGKENVEVHCQGSDEDFGVKQIPNGDHYTIEFWAGAGADYYCTFLFNEITHRFDIYLRSRDGLCGFDRICTWDIKENGPCFHQGNVPQDQCYPWTKN